MTRDELVRRIEAARAELDSLLDRIDDSAMIGPHPLGEWSGKDQLAHLAAWHEILLARMRGEPEADALGVDADRYDGMDTDEINDVLQRRDAALTLEQARQRFERSYDEVLARLRELDDGALTHAFSPGEDRPLIETVVGNTYEHYEEHVPLLEPLTAAL